MCVLSRLGEKLQAWNRIEAPDYVKTWISEGVSVPFKTESENVSFVHKNRDFSNSERHFINSEIKRLLLSDFIEVCAIKPKCVSPIHCVPKKNNSYRLITDLRDLNSHCYVPKYRNEDIRDAVSIVKPNDHFVTTDIQDGFFHLSIATEFRDYFGFQFQNVFYRWKVLPFGWSLSPYYFNKTVRAVITYLRSIGLRVTVFVDDFLLAFDLSQAADHIDQLLHTLSELGFVVNFEKSQLKPTQAIKYIGYVIHSDSEKIVVKAQAARISKLKRHLRKALRLNSITFRYLAQICGQCVSIAWAVTPGKLFLRSSYKLLATRNLWSDRVKLNEEVINELTWWLESVDHWNSRTICSESFQAQIVTDASHLGWGAIYEGRVASGDWNTRVSYLTSNEREMLAILMAIKAFATLIRGKRIQVLTDNISAVCYINHMGGPSQSLSKLARAIWGEAIELGVSIKCAHIAGKLNQESDFWSRNPDKHNWKLHPKLFKYINRLWGPHTIDRFANCQNTQLRRFNSRFWEPMSEGIDALGQVNWQTENNYVNPPFCLLPRVLDIIITQRAYATVIAPRWLGQSWLQTLKFLSIAQPLRLPNHPRTCRAMGVIAEPCRNPKWALFAWRIYGGKISRIGVGQ